MRIVHYIDDFLLELFPKYLNSNKNKDILKEELTSYYTFGPYLPSVTIDNEWAIIDLDVPKILELESDFNKVVSFCEKKKFVEAKKLLIPLIEKNPTISEYHRILGQILSDEGDQEEAINSLIDALKWNPKNGFALVMMGNIFAKHKNDIETALKYYNQALKIKPDDHIAVNNIGANLLQLGKIKEAIEYFKKAYTLNPNYPNTSFGLSIAYEKLGNKQIAFEYAIKSMKVTANTQDGMYHSAYASAIELANELSKSKKGTEIFNEFRTSLENKTGKQIKVEKDETIPTAAKMEFAENYNRDYHLIKYNPSYPAVEHLIMHELVHLELATEAREENCNMLYIAGKEKKVRFIKDHEKDLNKLNKEGYSDTVIANFITSLYEGINRQLYNAPIDLFIEDFLFEKYPELQPYQFISLNKLINEGKTAVTDKLAEKLTPKDVLFASKILNLVNTIQFKDLFGIDVVKQFNALPSEIKEANRMWGEFLEYRKDRKPGEEYEIVKHWGEDLKMDNYFELVDEEDYRNHPRTVEAVLQSIEDDPFGMEVDKNFKEKEMNKFLESQNTIGTNQAVIWFMVDALKYFENFSTDKIKKIAFEIAMIGTQGISPEPGKSYKVGSIPEKDFSGYHLLAYYYVSWKLAIPEMLEALKLPYEAEFNLAKQMFNSNI